MDQQLLAVRAFLAAKHLEPLLTREGVIKALIAAPPLPTRN